MGIKGLYSYLKHYRNDIDLAELTPAKEAFRIGVDAMSLLYRFKGDADAILALIALLRSQGHRIFFVFDGKPPQEKEKEIAARRSAKEDAATQAVALQSFLASSAAGDLSPRDREILEHSLARCQGGAWHMTRDARRAFQDRLWEFSIPYVKSLSEADDVLFDLVAAGKLDVVMSTDMDYLLAGVGRLWIPSRKGAQILEEIRLDDVLEGEGLEQAGLTDACILCGTEEREGLRGVPPLTAFSWIRHYGSLEGVFQSNVADRNFRAMFPSLEVIQEVRVARAVTGGAYDRMRPDHLERVREFLDSL